MATDIKPLSYLALLESGQYSDFVIECQGIDFKVHRAIVCSQSRMLGKAASGPFKEAQTSSINLTEEDPRILILVLLFLYTNDYDPMDIPEFLETAISPAISAASSFVSDAEAAWPASMYVLLVHALVFKYADMLGIEALKMFAARNFLADAPALCADEAFAKPLRIVYESTRGNDSYLRLPVAKICLLESVKLAGCSETIDVIMEHEPMAWRVGVALMEDVGG